MPTSDDSFRQFSPKINAKTTSGGTIIPKEQLTAFERWELASFDPIPVPKTSIPVISKPVEISPQARLDAEKQAADELLQIRQKAYEQGQADGHQAGYDAGYQSGYATGGQQAQAEAVQIHQLMQSLQVALNQVDDQLALSLLNLSLEIAHKMVVETLKIKPEIILKIVSTAISGLPQFNQNAHLLLSPEDADLVKKLLGEQLSASGWKIFPNAQIESGGCRVETAHSHIDATNPTRWKQIVESIGQDKSWLTT
ncbi:MAG: flagellar assembly protein FliH [Gallionella sp.]